MIDITVAIWQKTITLESRSSFLQVYCPSNLLTNVAQISHHLEGITALWVNQTRQFQVCTLNKISLLEEKTCVDLAVALKGRPMKT